MPVSTLCVGVDVHLNELVLRAVDKADGHEVLKRFSRDEQSAWQSGGDHHLD